MSAAWRTSCGLRPEKNLSWVAAHACAVCSATFMPVSVSLTQDGAAYRAHFTGKYRHLTFPAGHNVPQEAPQDFADAVIAADHL
jgi:hypothetical protein